VDRGKSPPVNRMSYKIESHKRFRKDIKKVPKHHQKNIHRVILELANNPKKKPPNSTALKGEKDVYRIRFGKYRLIVSLKHPAKEIFIIGVVPRGEVYKILERLLG